MKTLLLAISAALIGTLAFAGAGAQAPVATVVATPRITADLLSDTAGANLTPYMQHLIGDVQAHWAPPSASGAGASAQDARATVLTVTIGPDGELTAMRLEGAVQDEALDKAAWAATAQTKYAPLPAGLKQPLRLRLHFVVS